MIHALWSLKAGVGTTTIGVALALQQAKSANKEILLVDTQGDLPHAIGLSEPSAAGISEWLARDKTTDDETDGDRDRDLDRDLRTLEYSITSKVSMLPLGHHPIAPQLQPDKPDQLAKYLAADRREVIIDCGCLWRHEFDFANNFDGQLQLATTLLAAADNSWLVTKSCFLGLRRMALSPFKPTGVVLLMEAGRSLVASDVADLAKCPVIAQLEADVRVARAIDAGLLASDLPRHYCDTLADFPL